MVLEAVVCKYFGQTKLVKGYGTTRAGIQCYRCFDCGRTFVRTYTHKALDPLVKEQITQMVLNGSGIRDTARVLGVNRNTVSNQFKKSGEVVQVNPTYVNKGLKLSLKVDEMWFYVSKKQQPRWLLWVEDAVTREVVAFVFGRRTH